MQTWNAFQLVQSNGAYGGKTVTFQDPQDPDATVTGVLRRANSSSETPGNTLLLISAVDGDDWRDSDWYSVANTTLVEVA